MLVSSGPLISLRSRIACRKWRTHIILRVSYGTSTGSSGSVAEKPKPIDSKRKPTLVVLGTGWASFRLLRDVDKSLFDVTVVSQRNHMLFTPLLASTTVGTLEFRSIVEPVRGIKNIEFHLAECIDIDPEDRTVICRTVLDVPAVPHQPADLASVEPRKEFRLKYDVLVIGVGADPNTFGIPGVRAHTHFLKEVSDSRAIRMHILQNLERAETPGMDLEERWRLLHVVVVGGGPTGIEFAAEVHDFLSDVRRGYPDLEKDIRITVLEQREILGSFDANLRAYTRKRFRRQRIDVRENQGVRRVESTFLELDDGSIVPFGICVWSTGVGPREFTKRCDVLPKASSGRIEVNPYLQVKGLEHVFAFGDCAIIDDQPLPALAQVAERQGAYLADSLKNLATGRAEAIVPFKYTHMGGLAYIGEYRALLDLSHAHKAPITGTRGVNAFVVWRSAYLSKLGAWKNRLMVPVDWFKTFMFGRDTSIF